MAWFSGKPFHQLYGWTVVCMGRLLAFRFDSVLALRAGSGVELVRTVPKTHRQWHGHSDAKRAGGVAQQLAEWAASCFLNSIVCWWELNQLNHQLMWAVCRTGVGFLIRLQGNLLRPSVLKDMPQKTQSHFTIVLVCMRERQQRARLWRLTVGTQRPPPHVPVCSCCTWLQS